MSVSCYIAILHKEISHSYCTQISWLVNCSQRYSVLRGRLFSKNWVSANHKGISLKERKQEQKTELFRLCVEKTSPAMSWNCEGFWVHRCQKRTIPNLESMAVQLFNLGHQMRTTEKRVVKCFFYYKMKSLISQKNCHINVNRDALPKNTYDSGVSGREKTTIISLMDMLILSCNASSWLFKIIINRNAMFLDHWMFRIILHIINIWSGVKWKRLEMLVIYSAVLLSPFHIHQGFVTVGLSDLDIVASLLPLGE